MIDLDAYFERIGYTGERVPTVDTLCAIHRLHAQAIPFENLNPLLRWPVLLDAPSLERKLVHEGRGGYCFEHNLLVRHVLDALGYQTTGLGARVVWNVPEGVVTSRGHMLLRVEVQKESYVVDTGFGGLTLTTPLRLVPDVAQDTTHEPFRLRGSGTAFVMEAKCNHGWVSLYRFDLSEHVQADYEMANWYLSHYPKSHFLHNLMAARTEAGCRYALRNNELTVHHLEANTERRTLVSAQELREVLAETFRIRMPEGTEIDALLKRLTASEEKVGNLAASRSASR